MGEREIDLSSQVFESPISRPHFEVITGQGLDKMFRDVEKKAPKFWGLGEGFLWENEQPNIGSKMSFLRSTLRTIDATTHPDVAVFAHDRRYTPDNLIRIGKLALDRQIILRKKTKDAPKITTTYGDTFNEGAVSAHVMNSLLSEQDPIAEIVYRYDHWRLNAEEQPDTSHLHLGFLAFKLFLLSTRKEKTTDLIKSYAVEKFKNPAESSQ
jgi:hypothetical protein